MNSKVTGIAVIVALVLIIVGSSSFFIVPEGRQAIITELGKPVSEPITQAGVHFKTPFIQNARYVDKRILSWDGYPSEIPTKDKKYIKVDTTARWRIVDVLKFIQTVRNERGAKARLDAILDATTRDTISNHRLVEAVRNTNSLLEKIEARKKAIEKKKKRGEPVLEEEISGEIKRIKKGREKLAETIVKDATKELQKFGIKLIDLQLRRISYEKSVEKKVYERMISERQRVAEKIRSIGQGERARIEGRIQRDLKKIQSMAYRRAQKIRGKAEATAVKIYAQSMSRGPKFYAFQRTLEAYDNSLSKKVNFLLSSDSEFLRFLKETQ